MPETYNYNQKSGQQPMYNPPQYQPQAGMEPPPGYVQKSRVAAGILAITQENHSVRMSEVLCLAEEITAHTPNYFYSRRLSNPVYIEHMDKLFVREELQLTYAGDGGVGVQIPAQYIDTLPDATFRTEAFYREQLSD